MGDRANLGRLHGTWIAHEPPCRGRLHGCKSEHSIVRASRCAGMGRGGAASASKDEAAASTDAHALWFSDQATGQSRSELEHEAAWFGCGGSGKAEVLRHARGASCAVAKCEIFMIM